MMHSRTLLSLFAILVATDLRAARLDEVLAQMKVAGEELDTLSASFVQTDHDFILGDEETSEGELYLKIPGQIRWEYEAPAPKVLLVKGDLVRLYNPTANQVNEFERGKGGRGAGTDLLVGFGKSNERIGEVYDASLASEDAASVVLELVPKPNTSASIFTKIELTLDKKTWTPVRSVFHEPNRDWTDIRFSDVVLNGKLPPKVFELDLPANVEIIKN